jgi:hypothetical protein
MNLIEAVAKKIDRLVLLFAFVVLAVSLYLVYQLSQDYHRKETIASLDTMLTFTKNMLEEEQQHALSLALLLSGDQQVRQAYRTDDRPRLFTIITNKLEQIHTYQGYRFDVQVHDRELKAYLRSWDFSAQGEPLAGFREGLVLAKKSRRPLVSIEVGKRLNIKAIAPMLEGDRFLGSIEVIEGFDHLRKRLAEQGYRLFILMDVRFLPVATTLQNAPEVTGRYRLVGPVEDPAALAALRKAPLMSLGSFGYFTRAGYLFGYFDLRNFHNDRLGYLMITSYREALSMPSIFHDTPSVELNQSGVIIR